MKRILAPSLAALVALPAAAQKPSGGGPHLGPDFSPMLDDIAPGWRAGHPVIVDLNLPPAVAIDGPPLDIDIGARMTTTAIDVSPTMPVLGPLDAMTLENSWVVNINTAPEELLRQVPRLDAWRAEAVVNFREANGPFRRPSEICNVFGISQEMYLDLAPHLRCAGETSFAPPLMASR